MDTKRRKVFDDVFNWGFVFIKWYIQEVIKENVEYHQNIPRL